MKTALLVLLLTIYPCVAVETVLAAGRSRISRADGGRARPPTQSSL